MQFLLNPGPDRGADSWAGSINPDLGIFLLRTLRQAWHGEVKASVLGIEDGRSCPLRGLYRADGFIAVGIELADPRDRPPAARGIDPMDRPPRPRRHFASRGPGKLPFGRRPSRSSSSAVPPTAMMVGAGRSSIVDQG